MSLCTIGVRDRRADQRACVAHDAGGMPIQQKRRVRQAKLWQCNECGRRMTLRAAERAMNGDRGCPGCGGSDIDLAVAS